MSEIDELEAIAEQTAFGTHGVGATPKVGRPVASHCSAGHERTPENTRTVKRGRRIMCFCRDCEAQQKPRKRLYSAREYPL